MDVFNTLETSSKKIKKELEICITFTYKEKEMLCFQDCICTKIVQVDLFRQNPVLASYD